MSVIETLLDTLTPKQQDAISQFRKNVQDVLQYDHDDFYLLRWLKARNFDLKKSEDMLRKSLKWRKNFGTDDILEWDPPEVLKKYWPGGLFGFDKQGHPILWQVSNDFDGRGMMKSVKRSDIIKYHIWRLESISKSCREQSKKLGKNVACAVHLSDLSGFSMKMVFTPGITDITKEVFALTEANYPENLYSSYVINAPRVFAVFFNFLKPFMSEDTKRKIHILGRNWREVLLRDVVDADNLPAFWGGAANFPDDKCSDHISHGGKVPEKFYVQDKISIDRGRMTEVTLPRGGTHDLKFEVKKPGTVIRWMFETETHDIGFGIFFDNTTKSKESDTKSRANLEEFRKVSRVNSHLVPEDGNIRCMLPGTYLLQFDNSFSWVHSKKVFYEVDMMEPVEDPLFKDCQDLPNETNDIILESTYL